MRVRTLAAVTLTSCSTLWTANSISSGDWTAASASVPALVPASSSCRFFNSKSRYSFFLVFAVAGILQPSLFLVVSSLLLFSFRVSDGLKRVKVAQNLARNKKFRKALVLQPIPRHSGANNVKIRAVEGHPECHRGSDLCQLANKC